MLNIMKMELTYLAHALVRMKERGISKSDVESACKFPDKVEYSSKEKVRFLIKKIYFNKLLLRDHLLMVVCENNEKETIIVTVIDTSKISKYL